MKILITGVAGFIGMHLAKALLNNGHSLIGIDNINSYYDADLKYSRLAQLGISKEDIGYHKKVQGHLDFTFIKMDIMEENQLNYLIEENGFDMVLHLAAQAGVRYSVSNPREYINSNLIGFFNVLDAAKNHKVPRVLYASSSSVYGLNTEIPFSLEQKTDRPASLYAATKKSNELIAHSYSHLFGIQTMGVRFFTVYGPWGRPDMALFKFTKCIVEGNLIEVYNNGEMLRDFTYIDDIISGIIAMVDKPWTRQYNLQNIGRNEPVKLMDFINAIENEIDKKAIIKLMPLQMGDIPTTWADVSNLKKTFDYEPKVSLKEGVRSFVNWYRDYYKI